MNQWTWGAMVILLASVWLAGCAELAIEANSPPDTPILTPQTVPAGGDSLGFVLIYGADPDGDELTYSLEIDQDIRTEWSGY